jgi:hypothetical protein
MEKRGVVLDDEKTKQASTENHCPKCGAELGKSVNFEGPWCPNCGTEPFEKRPEQSK